MGPLGPAGRPSRAAVPGWPAYAAPPGGSDEFLGPDGAVRARWRQVADGTRRVRDRRPRRPPRASWPACSATRAPPTTWPPDDQSVRRPWTLDPVPLVLDERRVGRPGGGGGPAGRPARPGRRPTSTATARWWPAGLVPAELVLGHPAFLRPCTGHHRARRPPPVHRRRRRGPRGRREVPGRRRPDPGAVRAGLRPGQPVGPLAGAPHPAPGARASSAWPGSSGPSGPGWPVPHPTGWTSPGWSILTPGPLSETYFEHAYLASYLGYPWSRAGTWWSRTTGSGCGRWPGSTRWTWSSGGSTTTGATRSSCGPTRCSGCPGLVEVVRRGRVAVLNPLGSGILENPALAGLLDDLAPALLGEELALRGPESWWCGRPDGLSHVLARFDDCSSCPVGPSAGPGPVLPPTLSCAERERAARPDPGPAGRLGRPGDPGPVHHADGHRRRRPRPPAGGPAHVRGGRRQRRRRPGHGYRLLPGGLTRVGADPDSPVGHRAGARAPARTPGWRRPSRPSSRARGSRPSGRSHRRRPCPELAVALPGRVAAQLFVLGRSAEHAELVIRLIRTVLARLDQPLGSGDDGGAQSLQVLLSALGAASGFDPAAEPGRRRTTRLARPGPARSTIGSRRRSCPNDRTGAGPAVRRRRRRQPGVDARGPGRGRLLGARAAVGRHLAAGRRRRGGAGAVPPASADPVRRGPAQPAAPPALPARPVRGVAPRTWSGTRRGCSSTAAGAWSGPRSLVRLLRAVLVERRAGVVEDLLVESLLKTSESLIIFRRRAGSILQVAGAIDLLVYDVANPRSVLFQLDRLVDHLAELPKQSSAQRLGQRGAPGPRGHHPAAPHRSRPPGRRGHRPPADVPSSTRCSPRPTGSSVDLLDSLRRTYFAHERLSVLAGGRPEDTGGGS